MRFEGVVLLHVHVPYQCTFPILELVQFLPYAPAFAAVRPDIRHGLICSGTKRKVPPAQFTLREHPTRPGPGTLCSQNTSSQQTRNTMTRVTAPISKLARSLSSHPSVPRPAYINKATASFELTSDGRSNEPAEVSHCAA